MGQKGKRFRFQVLWVSDRTFEVSHSRAQAATEVSMNGCSCVLIELFFFFKKIKQKEG